MAVFYTILLYYTGLKIVNYYPKIFDLSLKKLYFESIKVKIEIKQKSSSIHYRKIRS
jgi:hypothetical protein